MKYVKQLLVFVFSLLLSIFVSVSPVVAATPTLQLGNPQSLETATQSAQDEIIYELPYPGILPDHPLYSLKAFRDRMVTLLINDLSKKAEFNLLQANKRLNAGVFLVRKDKRELALSTISKGNNYFDQAVAKAQQAQNEKRDVDAFIDELYTASLKHEEVLTSLEKDKDKDFVKGIIGEKNRVQKFQTSILKMKRKKDNR